MKGLRKTLTMTEFGEMGIVDIITPKVTDAQPRAVSTDRLVKVTVTPR